MSEIAKPERHLQQTEDFDYELKRIGSDDFSVLIPLMEDCFGMDVVIDYFRWKYTQNPAGSFIGFIAADKATGQVGGYYGVIPQIFELDGKVTKVFQSCDTMTHSKHRRRGLFRKLAMRCYQELRDEENLFVIGFGGGQSTPGFLKFGWQRIFDFRYYFKPAILCRFSKGSKSAIEDVNVSTAQKAIEDGLDITKKKASAKAKSVRTSEQINWRLSNPYHKYLALRVTNDDVSYMIFYLDKDKLVVFDVFIDNPVSGKKMMNFLSQEVLQNNFKGIISFCQEDGRDSEVLKKLGFISNPFSFGPLNERVPFIQFSDKNRMEEYLSPNDWCVTTYDHDSL